MFTFCQLFVYIVAICLHCQVFVNNIICLFTFSAVYLHCQLFVYVSSAVCLHCPVLFTISAVCLQYHMFVYIISCLFTFSAVYLHFQLFIYIVSCLFTLSAVCLQPFLIMCKINLGAKIQMLNLKKICFFIVWSCFSVILRSF